jgi:hypothetical protein
MEIYVEWRYSSIILDLGTRWEYLQNTSPLRPTSSVVIHVGDDKVIVCRHDVSMD